MMRGTALNPRGPNVGTSALEGKRFIYELFQELKPQKALDVGCGSGTYARMFPVVDWTGVEIWEPYVKRFSLDRLYERFILADARVWQPDDHYDLAIAGDVLEHMTVEEAKTLFDKLKNCSDRVVISIPVVPYPQDELDGNPYEKHIVEDWDAERVISTFGKPKCFDIELPVGVFVYEVQES